MPKLLWMSPVSLHDISSGASLHCRSVLESLSSSGFEIIALSSFIFEHPLARDVAFEDINTLFEHSPKRAIFERQERNIRYFYIKSTSIVETNRSLEEQNEFFNCFCEILAKFQPDIVMGYGQSFDTFNCFAHARRQNISTVYWLLNDHEHHYAFPNVDLILSDSKQTAYNYSVHDHINVTPVGAFIESAKVVSASKDPLFVTLVNPEFNKGLAIFAKLAHYCLNALPNLQFLVINSHCNFVEQIGKLHSKDDVTEHPFSAQDFPNVLMANATFDMRLVYEKTKVLAVPHLGYESWTRVASEALLNNIPCLGCNRGALAEVVNQGGILLEPPEHCLQDYLSIPTDEEILPWFEALEQLLTQDWTKRTTEAVANVNHQLLTSNLIKILIPYCKY